MKLREREGHRVDSGSHSKVIYRWWMVYRAAALPVLAGLADVEGIGHTAPNASGALCIEMSNFQSISYLM